jgi:RNA polymerase sigma-70 factor (ECF subfamily)
MAGSARTVTIRTVTVRTQKIDDQNGDARMIRSVTSLATYRRLKAVSPESTAAEVTSSGSASNDEAARSASQGTVSVSTIEALIARNYSGLRLLIQRRTGDPQLAADLLNDAVCTTWEKWQAGQIERPELIAGYIFQVAMNLLRNQRRKLGERPEKRATSEQLDALVDPDSARDQALEESMAARVRRLVRSMTTPRDRVVLTRFYLEEVDKESICQELGLEPLQFDKILHRARGRLRELVEAQGLRKTDLFSVLVMM